MRVGEVFLCTEISKANTKTTGHQKKAACKSINDGKLEEPGKGIAQSTTRRRTVKRFGGGFALALLARPSPRAPLERKDDEDTRQCQRGGHRRKQL